jgi:hypothetical protein
MARRLGHPAVIRVRIIPPGGGFSAMEFCLVDGVWNAQRGEGRIGEGGAGVVWG